MGMFDALLLSTMILAVLYRAPGEGRVTPAELRRRVRAFVAGRWLDLLHEATTAATPAAAASGVRPSNARAEDGPGK